jgi:hypothetical protein
MAILYTFFRSKPITDMPLTKLGFMTFRHNKSEGTNDFVHYIRVLLMQGLFRCEEHLYKRLRWSVGPSVRPSPTMRNYVEN